MIMRQLDEGTSWKVLECWDVLKLELVAIKVFSGVERLIEARSGDIELLEYLARHDRSGTDCVQMRNFFMHSNHLCIVISSSTDQLMQQRNDGADDDKRCYLFSNGDTHYLFGGGVSSRVLECWDMLKLEHVAIKKFSSEWSTNGGRGKTECLKYLANKNRTGTCCVKMRSSFVHSKHLCVVLEKLEPLLLSYFLDRATSISCDGDDDDSSIKPKAIKPVDFGLFGCSTLDSNGILSYCCGRPAYSAPENLLGLEWSFPPDMWSVGCILFKIEFLWEAAFSVPKFCWTNILMPINYPRSSSNGL
ncbi:hypothetical protein IFM89_015691 [Coptis chinensis]|uniref:Protein kinase domain-containing protein n=1 Tax=Coptis chinensis TaxID=261450 RepID=A0A835LZM1_9MAGN|nr:hypothetical protein IFM89_015691 [Coptis chinensis]